MILYKPFEVALMLKVSRTQVYRLISSGDLVATRIGGSIRVTEEDLISYVSSCRVGPKQNKHSRRRKLKHLSSEPAST